MVDRLEKVVGTYIINKQQSTTGLQYKGLDVLRTPDISLYGRSVEYDCDSGDSCDGDGGCDGGSCDGGDN